MSQAGDKTKLPKWAQREIERLESNVEHWKAKATEGPEDSDTFVQHGFEETPLGRRPTILFQLGEARFERIEVMLTSKGRVRVMGGGGGALIVRPIAANVIEVEQGDW